MTWGRAEKTAAQRRWRQKVREQKGPAPPAAETAEDIAMRVEREVKAEVIRQARELIRELQLSDAALAIGARALVSRLLHRW